MGLLGIIFAQNRVVIDDKAAALTGNFAAFKGALQQSLATKNLTGIIVDATVSEEHVSDCDVTENPVEDGAKITDHVQLKPKKLTIEGVISDAPLGYAIVGNIQNLVRSVSTLFGKKARSQDAFDDLLKLQESRKPFTVTTGLKRYNNMIMESLSVPRTSQTGAAIHFKAVMKEIRIVKSQTALKSLADKAKNIGSKAKDLGQKVTDAVPADGQLEKKGSYLFNKVGGNIGSIF